jgi:hypothetical protein
MVWDIYFWIPPDAEVGFSGRDKYLRAYDCKLKQEILFRVFPHCLPSDNPQQAESSSGVGPGGNRNCIRGKVGGGKEEQETDDGYHALFSVSPSYVINVVSAEMCTISQTRRNGQYTRLSTPLQTNFGWHAEVWHNLCQICKQILESRIRWHSSGLTRYWSGHQT